MKTTTRHGDFTQLVSALGNAPHLHVLAGKTEPYWPTTLAWQPADMLNLTVAAPDWPTQLRTFTTKHRGKLCIGYLGYEAGRALHNLPNRTAQLPLSDIHVAAFTDYVSIDPDTQQLTIHYENEAFVAEVDELLSRTVIRDNNPTYRQSLAPTIAPEQYTAAFDACQEYITAGDVYQLNLTHQLHGKVAIAGTELFLRLYEASTPGQHAYIRTDDVEIISGSPERFIQTDGSTITTEPIKGTRPRGATAAEDVRMHQELTASTKEQAELAMITDLLRNDLGKICQVGSVKLHQARTITQHQAVWHSHSTIVGRLADSVAPIDALLSMSPGGSITGCPKKRAMEIIDELEFVPRGLYTGTIFCIDSAGNLDSSIVIRTVIKHGEVAYLSVGGGIVHDSVCQAEFAETLNKAKTWIEL